MGVNLQAAGGRIREWLFRPAAVARARAMWAETRDVRPDAVRQARLLVEAARRVAEPVETLPPGSGSSASVVLYREAAYWALAPLWPSEQPVPDELPTLWAQLPASALPANLNRDTLNRVKTTLLDPRPVPLNIGQELAGQVRRFTEDLVSRLDAPRRELQRLYRRRWVVALVGLSLAVAVGLGARILLRGPDLVAHRPFRTSSSWAGCAADPFCVGMLFCTDPQADPRIEFDLGEPKLVRRIEAENRIDCCRDRAIPLVVETGNDQATWVEVGRQEAEFARWSSELKPTTARYVRLRVPRSTVFHLQAVTIR